MSAVALVAAVTSTLLYLQSRERDSAQAVIEVVCHYPDPQEITPFSEPGPAENLMRNEFLYPVIEKLQLRQKWAEDGEPISLVDAYSKLRHGLEVQYIRNTPRIAVSFQSQGGTKEAAAIVNEMVRAFMRDLKRDPEVRGHWGQSSGEAGTARDERLPTWTVTIVEWAIW